MIPRCRQLLNPVFKHFENTDKNSLAGFWIHVVRFPVRFWPITQSQESKPIWTWQLDFLKKDGISAHQRPSFPSSVFKKRNLMREHMNCETRRRIRFWVHSMLGSERWIQTERAWTELTTSLVRVSVSGQFAWPFLHAVDGMWLICMLSSSGNYQLSLSVRLRKWSTSLLRMCQILRNFFLHQWCWDCHTCQWLSHRQTANSLFPVAGTDFLKLCKGVRRWSKWRVRTLGKWPFAVLGTFSKVWGHLPMVSFFLCMSSNRLLSKHVMNTQQLHFLPRSLDLQIY